MNSRYNIPEQMTDAGPEYLEEGDQVASMAGLMRMLLKKPARTEAEHTILAMKHGDAVRAEKLNAERLASQGASEGRWHQSEYMSPAEAKEQPLDYDALEDLKAGEAVGAFGKEMPERFDLVQGSRAGKDVRLPKPKDKPMPAEEKGFPFFESAAQRLSSAEALGIEGNPDYPVFLRDLAKKVLDTRGKVEAYDVAAAFEKAASGPRDIRWMKEYNDLLSQGVDPDYAAKLIADKKRTVDQALSVKDPARR